MTKNDSKQQLQNLVYVIDRDFQLVYLNEETRRSFPEAKLSEKCYTSLRGESNICEDCPWAFGRLGSSASTRKAIYNAIAQRWLEISCISIEWPQVGPCTVVCAQNIDESKKDSFEQFTQQAVYDELLEVDLVAETFEVLYVEQGKYYLPTFTNSLADIEAIAQYLIHPDDRDAFMEFWSIERLRGLFAQGLTKERGEFRQKLTTGEFHWTSQTFAPGRRRSGNENGLYMCFILDIEEQKRRTAEELKVQSFLEEKRRERDDLTGLYRSEIFFKKAQACIETSSDESYQVACLDIKNFRLFNEWYGREAGDCILNIIADRLKRLEEETQSVVARLDSDNFIVCMPQGTSREDGLVEAIHVPSISVEENVGFFPVAGVCEINENTDLRTAIDRATLAKNLAKHNYVKGVAWYEEAAARAVEEEVRILLEIQRAIKNRELVLYWQPQCDIRSGCMVGAEALARWLHPERGIIPPIDFIPLLEKTGFIVNLDLYMWEEACRCLRSWLDAGIEPVPVSVNVSQTDLIAIDVPAAIVELVDNYDIDRSLLKIEITESAFAADDRIVQTTTRLKDLGFTVMMDDFGSGSSSLGILKQLDVDILKIDMIFLDWTNGKAGRGESIMESILRMAHLLDLCVVAEGVETEKQADFLAGIGCKYAQGYYFYRPIPTENFTNLLRTAPAVDLGGINLDSFECAEGK